MIKNVHSASRQVPPFVRF